MTPAPDYSVADRLARDQIASQLDETLFVEAGAGTGKTAALVQRYLALVLAGHSVERIVAITFTDKAAAELCDRVRQGLEAHLLVDCTAQERQRIDAALAGLDRAQISTIHAFGQMLLRSLAVRAGIDPAFEVEDQVAAERRFEERWRRYLDGLGSDRGAIETVGRVLDLGLNTRNLQALAQALWSHSEIADKLRAEPLTAPDNAEWPDLSNLREELVSLPTANVPEDDNLLKQLRQLKDLLDELLATPRLEREARLVGLMTKAPPMKNGRQPNWGGRERIESARELGLRIVGQLQETLNALRARALAEVLPLVVNFVIEETRARAREGRLVFDDLILRVRDALTNDRDARIDLRQRFDTILIDEFQDTDPLQADIAMAFATNTENGQPEPGRLFVVGDPKQSIYRFRGADMAFYAGAKQTLEDAGARQIDLSLNRRSQPGVLDWVNAVFAGVIGPGLDLEIQPPYKEIGPYRSDDLAGPAVSWIGEALPMPASQVRQLEARHVAAHCRDAVAQGWQVGERGAVRPARYGDIAVLLPARTSLPPLERALAAEGIPYRVEGGSLVYATQEVRDLINCLTAIDDPSDDVAVVAALRSPAYTCSDVEIARYRRDGGTFNYLWPQLDDKQGRVAEALRGLREWHVERRTGPLASLVERFVAARRLVEIGLVDSGNRNAFRRARFLVEQARAFEASGPESLRALVEWLEQRANDAIYDHEGAGLDDDEDAVRVLTIHAAKGLEFPIVFLIGLGTTPRWETPIFGHDRDGGRVAVRIGAVTRNAVFQLGPVEAVNLHEKLHADAERDRLLYVATTRARDHLILSLFHKDGTTTCAAARLILNGAREQAESLPPVGLATSAPASPFASLVIDAPGLDEAAFESERSALLADARRQRYTSATALGRHDAEPDQEEHEDESEPWSRGRAGTHLGRAVHAALQTLPWDADAAAIEAVANAQAVAEAVPRRAGEAAQLIRVALSTDAARRARGAKRALREVPFALERDGVILEGYVDLLIESEDGIEVIDWKTDHISPNAVEARLRQYELQAGVYVLGIEAATGRSVSRVTYVFVSAGREVEMPDPASLREAALQRLAQETTPV
ncbi:MAG TPA: UvrD-helicase domain-containing protein [Dehalococcoidia bacterium]|nr:UvrD-helicase domain-containing protein [Dehalococcoidia bacterium]